MTDSNTDLFGLHHGHQGKVSDKWQIYLNIYNRVLQPYRKQPVNLLEIGIQNGGSLEVWSEYFDNARHIVGCDINPDCARLRFNDSRIQVVVGDANLPETQRNILKITPDFDIVIDDGSHTSRDIIHTFALYFDQLKDGGIYIIEDLHCSYWQDFDGGLFHPYSAIAFLKSLVDVVNYEHWGLALDRNEVLRDFYHRYGSRMAADLSHIHSVEFINSVCVIQKRLPDENELGKRCVVGQADEVISTEFLPNGTKNIVPDQAASPYLLSPFKQLAELTQRNEQLRTGLDDLSRENGELKNRLRELTDSSAGLSDSVREQKNLNSQLENAMQESAAENENLKNRLENAVWENGELKIKLASLTERLSAKLSDENKKYRSLQNSLQNETNRLSELGSFTSGLQFQLYEMYGLQHNLQYRFDKYRKLWTITLFKPFIKTEQAISSLNRYRRGFRILTKEKGSVGKAYQTVRKLIKQEGLREGKKLLKTKLAQGKTLLPVQADPIQPAAPVHHRSGPPNHEFVEHLFRQQQNEFSLTQLWEQMEAFERKPLVSIIMPVYKTPVKWLARVIESLQEQIYTNWELCAVDDCSPTDEQRKLLETAAKLDPRVRHHFSEKNGGISAASNLALEMAKGEFVALVDHDDEITPDALFWVVKTINEQPDADFLYSDECKIDDTEARHLYHLIPKPNWSPEIMFNGMITGHLTTYLTEQVRRIGGFRSEYDFSQDYDLALRMSRVAKKIVHIERILYLWRSISGSAASGDKPFARTGNLNALQNHIDHLDVPVPARVKEQPLANCVEVSVNQADLVSIVIPSDSYKNLKEAINGILGKTIYARYEIIAVCNSPLAQRLQEEYAAETRLRFSPYDKPYNFSDKCNQGAHDAAGKFIVFYNDDVVPENTDWLYKLLEYLYLPGVGATSPKLLFENNTIQYAGMISGTPGLCGTAYNSRKRDEIDYYLSMHQYVRNISILSGACCAMRKELFDQIGGFDAANTPDGHSDVDLSYKIMEAGYRCVYTPYSVLYHIGNHSWGAKKGKYKADIFCLKRWGKYVSEDPYFTDTMKQAIYTDFRFNYKIYAQHIDPDIEYSGKDVLFVSHELSETGAPRMLYYAALAVKNSGGFPVVAAPIDGSLRQAFIDAGIVVIVDESIRHSHFLFKAFARNFDTVVVNTIALASVVRDLQEFDDLPVIWWLHEARSLPESLAEYADLAPKAEILCVSRYAQSFVPEIFESRVLYNGIPDKAGDFQAASQSGSDGKYVFSLFGTFEPRKGQDIFCEAITLLPDEIRRNCRFEMAGKLWHGGEDFFNHTMEKISDYQQVYYFGELSHTEMLDKINQTDVLVSCSRDDPFPLVCMEAAMLGKAVILNENVGTTEVLLADNACLAFESENPQSLADQMVFAYENREQMKRMGHRARETFEERLSYKSFAQAFLRLL